MTHHPTNGNRTAICALLMAIIECREFCYCGQPWYADDEFLGAYPTKTNIKETQP